MLFTPTDLTDHLGSPSPISTERAQSAERLVWGWLKPILGLTDRPFPVPDEVFSWAIELGGIAHENPTGLTSKQLGPGQQHFSLERRTEILREALLGGLPTSSPAPVGCFPAPLAYPDPAF